MEPKKLEKSNNTKKKEKVDRAEGRRYIYKNGFFYFISLWVFFIFIIIILLHRLSLHQSFFS